MCGSPFGWIVLITSRGRKQRVQLIYSSPRELGHLEESLGIKEVGHPIELVVKERKKSRKSQNHRFDAWKNRVSGKKRGMSIL